MDGGGASGVVHARSRPPDEEGTPFQRFERALKKVMTVPRAKLDEREREWKRRKPS